MPFVPSIITTYGLVHTVISLVPVLIGLYLYLTKGTINLNTAMGKAYWLLGLIGAVTGITIVHHGAIGPGHAVSLVMMACLLTAGVFAWLLKAKTRTVEVISTSFSYFFLWFFTTTESLTRLPVDHPFSPSPEALQLAPIRGALLVILCLGIWLQLRVNKKLGT